MTEKNEALRLADALDVVWAGGIAPEAAAELRRLHTQRDALLEALKRAEPLLIGPILLQARAAIKSVEE